MGAVVNLLMQDDHLALVFPWDEEFDDFVVEDISWPTRDRWSY
jgi:hypothetical protein